MTKGIRQLSDETRRKLSDAGKKGGRIGGLRRAQSLSPEQRSAIARKGWLAMVEKCFLGDEEAARQRWAELGAYNGDPYNGDPIPRLYPHPGSVSEFMQRWQEAKRRAAMVMEEKGQ